MEVFPTTNLLDVETAQKLNEYTKKQPTVKSTFSELLRKIAGVIAEHGCKDVKEWMQTNPWYREFENGQKIEREFKRSNSIER